MKIPQETLDYFKSDELRARVFVDKYALKDKKGNLLETTPDEMWRRVAREIASVEENDGKRKEWEEKFYWLLENFRMIPGGRIMFGAGQKDRKVTLLNCYVIPMKGDSLEDIYETMKEMARTYSYGGGVGIDISILRPKGSPVKNSAMTSTGSVSFMDLFSLTTGTIGQSGRRGALMITIHCSHPDVEDFITIKNDPLRIKVRYANISVLITDEFMKAVEEDSDWELWYPDIMEEEEMLKDFGSNNTEEIIEQLKNREDFTNIDLTKRIFYHFPQKTYFYTQTGELRKKKIYKVVKAREIWDKIIHNAWASAEPGVIFYSNMLKNSTSEYNDIHILTTNPCVTKDTRILTTYGWVKMYDLFKNKIPFKGAWDTRIENKDQLGCKLADCTQVFQSSPKARIFKITTSKGFEIKATQWHTFYVLKDKSIMQKKQSELKKGDILLIKSGDNIFGTYGKYETGYKIAKATISRNKKKKNINTKIPETVWQGTKECIIGYLKGIIELIGIKEENNTIKIELLNEEFAKEIQILFLSLGIISKRKENIITLEDNYAKKFKTKIEESKSAIYYKTEKVSNTPITVEMPYSEKKEKKVEDKNENDECLSDSSDFYDTIESIEMVGEEDVYDTTQLHNHTIILNGIVTGNCSEIPLEAYGNCCLGNINLARFVENAFEDEAKINWDDLERAIRYTVRFLDNTLTYNHNRHPLTMQSVVAERGRRIGVGFTGLGDMLIKLKIKYDSEEAIELVDKLFEKIKNIAYDESVNLAIEKGVFPAFDPEKHLQSSFIKNLSLDVQRRIKENGLRNVGVLTVPPVGSGAILAGVTSGIEPVFALSYIRKSDSLSKKEFKVYHPLVIEYAEKYGTSADNPLPEFFVTAHQIDPYFRVKMQATIQKHIDHSISSTVNLPESTSHKTISDIYFYAWKLGCKGITVYREGSREGILVTENKENKKEEKTKFIRPKKLFGETVKMKMGDDVLYVTINKDEENKIREVFVNMGKSGGRDKAVTEALGRIISIYLQEGGDIMEVVKQLREIKADEIYWDNKIPIHSIPDAIAKAISLTLNDSIEHHSLPAKTQKENNPRMEICKSCGEKTLVNENGCWTCRNCGYSKCQ